jgi:hypothetical protein
MKRYRDCLKTKSIKECNDKYGSYNPRGINYVKMHPLNPLYTGCVDTTKPNRFVEPFF